MTSKREFRSFEEWMIETLQDKEEVKGYFGVVLQEYLEDRDIVPLLDSLRMIAEAQGGSLRLTKCPDPDQQNLDELLEEIPELGWTEVLEALGYTVTVATVEHVPSL